MGAKPDFVVVGAGIVGCLTAWELGNRGYRVAVLEADEVAAGASGGVGSRGVRANGRDPRELPLAGAALRAWPELAETLGPDSGWDRTGHLLLTERAEDLGALREIANRQRTAGIETSVVEGDDLRELEPGLSGDVVAAAWCPHDGVADHTATTRLAAAAAADAGVEIRERYPVSNLGEVDAARGILVAANQRTSELVGELGCALPLFPVFPQVVMVRAEGSSPRRLIGHMHRRLVMKRMDPRTVMVTGGRLGAVQPDGSVLVEPAQIDAALADASSTFHEMESASVSDAVADRAESVAPDLVPIIDHIDYVKPVWLAAGWSGHGFALAPAVARSLAEWMTTGERPEVLAPFARARFS